MGIIKAVDLAFEYIRRDEEGNVEAFYNEVLNTFKNKKINY